MLAETPLIKQFIAEGRQEGLLEGKREALIDNIRKAYVSRFGKSNTLLQLDEIHDGDRLSDLFSLVLECKDSDAFLRGLD